MFRRSAARLLAGVLVVGLAVAIGSWLVGRVLRPIRLVTSEQRERDRIAAEYRSLAKQNDDLRRQLGYLGTRRGIERRARKLGFVLPGEITLVVPEHQTKPKPKP